MDCILTFLFPAETDVLVPVLSQSTDVVVVNFVVVLKFPIMDFTAKENIPGLLLFIDFQKAFDSVEWEFLIESLKRFNFGRDFLQWVKTFYNNIQSCVITMALVLTSLLWNVVLGKVIHSLLTYL